MTADEIAKAEKLSRRRRGSRDNSGQAGAHDAGECLGHSVPRFADGNNQRPYKAFQIVNLAADPEVAQIILQVAAERSRDAALTEGVLEHLSCLGAHFAQAWLQTPDQRETGASGACGEIISGGPLRAVQEFLQPALQRKTHLHEMAVEEVIAGNEHQFLRIGGLGNDCLQSLVWTVLIVIAADEQLGLPAVAQKRVGVQTAFGLNWCTDRDQGLNIRIGTGGAQSGGSPKGKACEDDGQLELVLQPSERSMHVGDLTASLIVLTGAQSRATEVEAQHRKSERIQGLHGMEDNFVVHGSTPQRVRVANEARVGRTRRTQIQQRFQAASRSIQEQ